MLSIAEQLPAPENKSSGNGSAVVRCQDPSEAFILYEHAGGVGAVVNSAVMGVDRLANGEGLNNIIFVVNWQTGDVRSLLVDAGRACEAALLMRRLVWPSI